MATTNKAIGIICLGPYLSANFPTIGLTNPDNHVPIAMVMENSVSFHPVSSKIKTWTPPKTTWATDVAAKVEKKDAARIAHP
tara:strand:+ start:1118 stop:1363 length:246 start_codon:yes stop_codon:yes gene_type:complete